ncbi:UvrD-helicase domain-containing protein [Bremerella sp.]|uniref:UvrD-helicase domain-containing protein n=1 Tax=Bremerella sp. TaxID=2795602 RepID=UPI00391C7B81
MSPSNNRVIIACAGSGKTTRLVKESLSAKGKRTAIVTYTNNNVREIINRFCEVNSGVPTHVDVMTWFGFLLRECARPYQRVKYSEHRIESIRFVSQQSALYVPENETRRYYFANGGNIYSDKIAQFVVQCENISRGSVTGRLQDIYANILIDEFQDLSGWDLNFVESLMKSGLPTTLVGDPRQHTYSTNPSRKNKKYLGSKFTNLAKKWERLGRCNIEDAMNESHRCNQAICDFVNLLWPEMDPMQSLSTLTDKVTGVFRVSEHSVNEYIRRCKPQVLRNNKNAKSYGCDALNFGSAKGLEFDHVLIVPTTPIKKFLMTGEIKHVEKGKHYLHVAVTRAKHSVGFVLDGSSPILPQQFA